MKLKSFTPLRYPGGKSKIYEFVKRLIETNFDEPPVYCEAFAGGAGLALKLLLNGVVSDIFINDLDDRIYSFWVAILEHKDDFVNLIKKTEVNIQNWNLQRKIYENPRRCSIIKKGFATFFLNRTNRSGIMKAGPIGGKNQTGNFKLDCRFNKEHLIEIINAIYEKRDNIHVSRSDAKEFVNFVDNLPNRSLIYLDPPYVSKGPELYKNSFVECDHRDLSLAVSQLKNKWFITYDNHEIIKVLYENYRLFEYEINYSVSEKKVGIELIIFSDNIEINNKSDSEIVNAQIGGDLNGENDGDRC